MSNRSRIPSPSRSQGAKVTPRRHPARLSSNRSVGSPGRPLRLSTLVQRFKNDEMSSPANLSNYSGSVLSDNTDIVEPRRRSWWKAANVMSILENDENQVVNDVIEEFEPEVLSQSNKYDTFDLPESSGSESIASIIIPDKQLFAKKQKVLKRFPRVSESRALQKTLDNEKTIALKASPKKLFKTTQKRSRPHFPDALLDMSTIINKTSGEKTIEVKAPLRNLLNNRETKRKNMFQNFIAAESDDDISDVQPSVFGFHKSGQPRNRGNDPQSPSSSIASDLDTHWNLLPSSTMMEGYGFEPETPGKRIKLSKISNIRNVTLKDRIDTEIGINNVSHKDNVEVVQKQAISEQRKSIRETSIIKNNINKSKRVSIDSINLRDIPELVENNETPKDKSKSSESSINNTVKEKSKENVSQIVNKSLSKSLNKSKTKTQLKGNDSANLKSIQRELQVAEDINMETVEGVHVQDNVATDLDIDKGLHNDDVLESENESEDEEQIEDPVITDEVQEVIKDDLDVDEGVLESDREEEMEHDQKQESKYDENVNENMPIVNKQCQGVSISEREGQNHDELENMVASVGNGSQKKIDTIENNEGVALEDGAAVTIEIVDQEECVGEYEQNEIADDNKGQDESRLAEESEDVDEIRDDNEEQDESAVDNEEEDEVADDNVEQEESTGVAENDEDAVADDDVEQEESAAVADKDEEEEDANDNVEQEESAEISDENEEQSEIADDYEERDESVEVADENEEEVANDNDEQDESADENEQEEFADSNMEQAKSEGSRENYEKDEIADDYEEREESAEVADEDEEDEVVDEIGEQEDRDESEEIEVVDNEPSEGSGQIEADDQSFDNRADAEYTSDVNPSINEVTKVNSFVQNSLPPATKVSQKTFVSFLEKIKQNNLAKQEKIRETFKATIKPSVTINTNIPTFKRVSKPKPPPLHVPTEFKPKRKTKTKFTAETLAALPKDFYEDLKYRPPKRYTPPNSAWATKRLYNFLENKLEPRYDYMARIQAEKFVNKLFMFSKQIKKLDAAPRESIQKLQYKMASLNIIETYCDFYDFIRDYLPKEIKIKVIPDVINKLPLPPEGIHSRIIDENNA